MNTGTDYSDVVAELARRLVDQPNAGAILVGLLQSVYNALRDKGVGHAEAYHHIDLLGDAVITEVEKLIDPPQVLH